MLLLGCVAVGCTYAQPLSPSAADPLAADFTADAAYCAAEINRLRATVGAPPLTRSGRLEAFATEAARVDTEEGVPHTHFRQTNGGNGMSAAENVIPWWLLRPHGTVRNVIRAGLTEMWSRGSGSSHYEIMRGGYTEVGCGVFAANGEVTVSQEFR